MHNFVKNKNKSRGIQPCDKSTTAGDFFLYLEHLLIMKAVYLMAKKKKKKRHKTYLSQFESTFCGETSQNGECHLRLVSESSTQTEECEGSSLSGSGELIQACQFPCVNAPLWLFSVPSLSVRR